MNKPSGKLELAYRTIASLEAKVGSNDAELAALRQQLADVSNERDGLQHKLEVMTADRDALDVRLVVSETERRKYFDATMRACRISAGYMGLLREVVALDPRGEFMGWELDGRIDAALAQSAPASSIKYDDVLMPFLGMMRKELQANSAKGDRPGWLSMSAAKCFSEINYHVDKLGAAVRGGGGDAIGEHAADVANLSMMMADICGSLALFAQSAPATDEQVNSVTSTIDKWVAK